MPGLAKPNGGGGWLCLRLAHKAAASPRSWAMHTIPRSSQRELDISEQVIVKRKQLRKSLREKDAFLGVAQHMSEKAQKQLRDRLSEHMMDIYCALGETRGLGILEALQEQQAALEVLAKVAQCLHAVQGPDSQPQALATTVERARKVGEAIASKVMEVVALRSVHAAIGEQDWAACKALINVEEADGIAYVAPERPAYTWLRRKTWHLCSVFWL